jgi:uroporphyrinogen-III decarboxylase
MCYPTPATAYEGVVALGGELIFPQHHQPMLVNQGRIITRVEQVDTLRVPAPDSQPRFRQILAWHNALKSRYGTAASPGIAGQEGPITTAVLLQGREFFIDCLDDPMRAHKLLEVCTEMFILWNKRSRKEDKVNADTAMICDHHAGLIRPDLWDEFVIPYYARIAEELGPNGLWLHTELVNASHLPHLQTLDLVGVNFAGEHPGLSRNEKYTR